MTEEDNAHGVFSGAKAKPKSKMRRTIIAVSACLVFLATVLGSTFYILWGYINPGWNFKVFVDDGLPSNFDNALKIIKDTVYSDSAELAKWVNPIRITCEGDPDETDIEVLNGIFDAYNTIPGFPGITIVEENANASITFATKENHKQLQDNMKTTDTSVCRVTTVSRITKAEILIEPGGGRGYRNTIMLHESFHMLGFMGHTSHARSIVNDKLPVTGLCGADKLAFMIIYYPDIFLGTGFETLEALIKQYTVEEFAQMSAALAD